MIRRKKSRESKIRFVSYDSAYKDLDYSNYVDYQAYLNS